MRLLILPITLLAALALGGCEPKPGVPPQPKASMAPALTPSAPTTSELRSQAATALPGQAKDSIAAGKSDVDETRGQGTTSASPRTPGPMDGQGNQPVDPPAQPK